MANWKTTRGWGHDPESGSDRDSAYSFKITDGHDERQITVEWAAGGCAVLELELESEHAAPLPIGWGPDSQAIGERERWWHAKID